jgi:hypothetical protein
MIDVEITKFQMSGPEDTSGLAEAVCNGEVTPAGLNIACPYIIEMTMPLFFFFEVPTGNLKRNILGFIRNGTSGIRENTYGVQFKKLSGSLSDMISYAKIATRIVLNNAAAG